MSYLENVGKERGDVKTIIETEVALIAGEIAKQVIDDLKLNIPKGSGALASSIAHTLSVDKDGSLIVEISGLDYWDYVNSGVDGVKRSAGAIVNQFGEVYRFKYLNPSGAMVDAIRGVGTKQNWLASAGLIAKDGNYESLAYAIGTAVKRDGIKPADFVEQALNEQSLSAFDRALLDAFENII